MASYLDPSVMNLDEPLPSESPEQSHLRGSTDVTGYRIHAKDGEIGHLEDLVVDAEAWIVRYVEVDRRNWLPGKKVLVQSGRIQQIDWENRSVTMSLTRHAIELAPPYDPSMLITPDYEVQLFNTMERRLSNTMRNNGYPEGLCRRVGNQSFTMIHSTETASIQGRMSISRRCL
jgi:hypothetical protein